MARSHDTRSAARQRQAITGESYTQALRQVLQQQAQRQAWTVPGLIRRQDRIILSGPAGVGKTQLLQQIAVLLATGLHPFTIQPIMPVQVLLVDVETPAGRLRQQLQIISDSCRPGPGLALAAPPAQAVAPADLQIRTGPVSAWPEPAGLLSPSRLVPDGMGGQLEVLSWPEGADLLRPGSDQRQQLAQTIEQHHPAIVILGPVYRLCRGDFADEETTRQLVELLNSWRTGHNCALVLEAHNGRPGRERPYGSSLWLRWPEMVLSLRPVDTGQDGPAVCDLVRPRAARQSAAGWPSRLYRQGQLWLGADEH
jgi:replicative DNA helicase